MNARRRLSPVAVALACVVLARGALAEDTSAADVLAEIDRAAREAGVDLGVSRWDVSGFVEGAAGYNDNVVLAPHVTGRATGSPVTLVAPDGSGFVRGRINALAWRLPENGFDWFATVDATSTHFFSARSNAAQFVISRAEARWQPRDPVRFSLGVQYAYDDEVIDASTFDSGLAALQAKIGMLSLEPSVRWRFAPRWTATLKLTGSNDAFNPPLYDYREAATEFVVSRELGSAGRAELVWTHYQRPYEDRPQVGRTGRVVAGSRLALHGDSGGFRYELERGESFAWRLTVKASYFKNLDNASGWYDSTRQGLQAGWSCTSGRWHFEAETAWRKDDYRLQTINAISGSLRARTEWSARLRLERDVAKNLAAFVELESDRNHSNDIFLDYRNAVSAVGLRWNR